MSAMRSPQLELRGFNGIGGCEAVFTFPELCYHLYCLPGIGVGGLGSLPSTWHGAVLLRKQLEPGGLHVQEEFSAEALRLNC